MLRQRVITALLLLAVLLPALLAPSALPFDLFSLVAIAAAAWEWARLNDVGRSAPRAVASAVLLAALCAACLALWPAEGPPASLWRGGLLMWLLGLALVLRAGPAGWPRLRPLGRWAGGLLLLWLAWAALVQARHIGVHFLLSVLCIVWMADIAAYFAGRAWGRRKLAPSISPGKSWEGVWGGVVGVLLLALAWLAVEPALGAQSASVYSLLRQGWGLPGLVLALLLLTGLGVAGDLFESLVKRAAGVKDSSALLPGHGGVLDRVDALLPVLPAALALVLY